jgi:hypothetical protein
MGYLNDLVQNKTTQETTMPGWYDQAQQNVVNKAAAGAGQVPGLSQTSAGQAINQVMGNNNPFFQAQNSLNSIASSSANPWMTDASGQVTPNTATPLGGLFQAQNQQLQQLMPNYTAPVEGANIASGNFGSLRGQTAVNKAMGDAQSKLFADQMQAALQNQQTGVNAATGLGDVGSKGIQSMTALGQAQQSDPLLAATGLGKIVAGINSPTTVTQQTQTSPLNLIQGLLSGAGGSIAGMNKILEGLNIKGGIGGLPSLIGGWFGGGDKKAPTDPKTGKPVTPSDYTGEITASGATRYPLEGGGYYYMNKDGTKTWLKADGSVAYYDKDGMPINPDQPGDYSQSDTTTGGGGGEYTGPIENTLDPNEEVIDWPDTTNVADNGPDGSYEVAFNDDAYNAGGSNNNWFDNYA